MNPYNFNPYQPYTYTSQQLIRVTGIEGAKAYQMSANSTVALFDNNEDLMYIKTTDGAGFPSIRVFKFTEQIEETVQKIPNFDFVSRKEFNEFKEALLNGKQFVSEPTTNNNKSNNNKSGKTVNE